MDDDDNDRITEQAQAPQLTAIELRVLGSLMEKQLTTPDTYPLTINSITTACNQKSSRDPVTNYQQGEIVRALNELEGKHFVRKEYGSRTEKYSQNFINHLELGKKHQAVLCVMMLRGPQSLSELHTRTQRMAGFADKGELEHCVDRLCNRETPFAVRLVQQPGQRGERIGHLFSGMPVAAVAAVGAVDSTSDSQSAPEHNHQGGAQGSNRGDTIELLEMEVESLHETVNSLKGEISGLQQQLADLYRLTGYDLVVTGK